MPHLVKKIANAFENSGVKITCDLEFKGQKLSLMMLLQIQNCDRGRELRLENKHIDGESLQKNAYSRMRVHLATQVFSNSMSMIIKAHTEKCGGIDKYALLLLTVEKLDR